MQVLRPSTISLSARRVVSCSALKASTHMGYSRHIPASSLHVSKPTWWLESRFHFSFANYSDGPTNFGALRVLNDDLVHSDGGFGFYHLLPNDLADPVPKLIWNIGDGDFQGLL